jgi:DNA-binding ferritin-like protein (Dps family)
MVLSLEEAKKLGLKSTQDQVNVPSPTFVKIYTNNVAFGATNWDTYLVLGEILGLDENGKAVVEQKAKVNMTREFMKALSNLLVQNIKEYEEKFGEISFDKLSMITDDLEAANAKLLAKKPAAKKPQAKRLAKKS